MIEEASRPMEHSLRSRPWTAADGAAAWFAIIFAFVGISLAAGAIVLDPWDHDAGYYLLRSSYVASGLRPHIDYQTIYPPVVDVLTAPVIATRAPRLMLAIAIPMLWMLANAAASILLAWRITRSRSAALLIGSLYLLFALPNDADHLTLEHGVSLFSMLALAAVSGDEDITPWRAALAGAALSLAAGSKHPGVITALPLAAILWSRLSTLGRRHAIALAAGVLAVPLVVLAWLDFRIGAIFRDLITRVGPYASTSPGARHNVLVGVLFTALWEARKAPALTMFYAVCAVAGFALVVRVPRVRWIAAAALAGAAIEYAPRALRNYPHYSLNVWPFLVLLLALALARLGPAARNALVAALCVSGVLLIGLAPQYESSTSILTTWLVPAASLTEAHTPPGGKVRQYGSEPMIEFLASRAEEHIDKNARVMTIWDGRGMYDTPPARDTTVVVLDWGQSWIEPQLAELRGQGFVEVDRYGRRNRVIVMKHGSTIARP